MPKGIAKIAALCPRDGSKYAFNGVLVSRKGDKATAVVTDGRRLLKVTWVDRNETPLPGFEELEKPVENYRAVLPGHALKRACATAAKLYKGQQPTVLIDEPGTNGKVRIASHDPVAESTTSVECPVVDGKFPPFDDVIPNHKDFHPKSGRAVRIGVGAYLLAELLVAMADAVPGDDAQVVMEVPDQPSRPIKIIRTSGDVEAVGVLMPCKINDERK